MTLNLSMEITYKNVSFGYFKLKLNFKIYSLKFKKNIFCVTNSKCLTLARQKSDTER